MSRGPINDWDYDSACGFEIDDAARAKLISIVSDHCSGSVLLIVSTSSGYVDDRTWEKFQRSHLQLAEALSDPGIAKAVNIQGWGQVDLDELKAILGALREIDRPTGAQTPERELNAATIGRLYDWWISVTGSAPATAESSSFVALVRLCLDKRISRDTIRRAVKLRLEGCR